MIIYIYSGDDDGVDGCHVLIYLYIYFNSHFRSLIQSQSSWSQSGHTWCSEETQITVVLLKTKANDKEGPKNIPDTTGKKDAKERQV